MNPLLYGKELVKAFGAPGDARNVLNRVSVEVRQGEFVSVMGPSGSGKSTLLYALSGMDRVDGGEVFFEGRPLSGLTDEALSDLRRNEMGFVFQQPTLLKNLNILDNIILPQTRDHHRDVKKLVGRARLLMRRMGIEELEGREVTQASGGQLQRAGICRALMNEPKIIFGDEPTGALNTKAAKEIMELFAQINREGATILLVTHDPGVAARTERVLFLCDGQIVSECRLPKFTGRNLDERVGEISEKMRDVGI